MPATVLVDITGDVHDLIGGDFNASRTKVVLAANTDHIVATDLGIERLGTASLNVAADGTFTFADVIASTDLVENLQYTVRVDYPVGYPPSRKSATFGPYELTVDADVSALEEVQALDAIHSSVLMAEMEALRDEAEAAALDAVDISGISTSDGVVSALIDTVAGPLTQAALSASIDGTAAANVMDRATDFGEAALDAFGKARALVRRPLPAGPCDLGTFLTPAPQPFQEKDGLKGVLGWDRSWLLFGEDGQLHAVSKLNLSTYRMDRTADYADATDHDDGLAWYQGMLDVGSGVPTGVSPNAFLYGGAKESWTFVHSTGHTVETGYAIVVGTGDYTGSVYRPPTVIFCREGADHAQSLTAMLDTAGIMDGSTATPKSLMGASRVAADTFYLFGSGANASTNPGTERPTFGRMVLTLNSSKTELGASSVSSLTWTDRLSVLQGVVTAGFPTEVIVNVPAVADALMSNILHVLVITKDGSDVLRGRMVLFDHSNATAALDTKLDKDTGAAVWPRTPGTDQRDQTASITVGDNGILWVLGGASSHYAYYRGTAGTTWRNVGNQAGRAMGLNVAAPFQVRWDDYKNRFLITSSSAGMGMGWLDADCKQGHYLTRLFPWAQRIVGLDRTLRGVWADRHGIVVVGAHQLAAYLPDRGETPPAARVVWGCRVSGTAVIDEVSVSAGEVEFVDSTTGLMRRVYVPGNLISSGLGDTDAPGGPLNKHTIVVRVNAGTEGVANKPLDTGGSYVGAASGTDYPEPATHQSVMVAQIDRANNNTAVITSAEISHAIPDHRDG